MGYKNHKNKKKPSRKDELRQLIQGVFYNQPKRTFNYKQIAALLEVKKKSGRLLVQNLLMELFESGYLSEVTGGKYKLLSRGAAIIGKVDMTASGSAYVVPLDGEGQDIFISRSNINQAMHGDKVKVYQSAKRRGRQPEGEIVEIIERKRETFVGVMQVSKGSAFLVVDDRVMPQDIFIPLKSLKGAKDGDKAIAKIVEWPERAKNPIGEIVDVLGAVGDHHAEMHAILAEFNLPYKYPENVNLEAEKISDVISDEEVKKRRDFRKVTTFTIDPHDAKDFDDALSIQKLDNGNWEIGVHIADVTHYVDENSIIEEEAYSRATSVYLVDRVVPMLPERLSNYICSLRPNEEKLCFSAVFEINERAEVIDTWVGRTVIYSDRRFTYEEAQEIIETGKGDYSEEILIMDTLAKKLRDTRFAQGAIGFERTEVRFNIDENGKPLGVVFKESKDSNKLIEEYMLLANKRVSEIIGKNELTPNKKGNAKTFVYRIHDVPNQDKFENFASFVRKLGYEASPKGAESVNSSLNRLLAEVKGKGEQNIVETLAVRTMAKAIYSTHNIGHYGLAFKHYSHFTSPIRRYPDMIVHRLLQRYLDGGNSVEQERYEEMCEHSSDMEQRSAGAERASIKYKQVEFLKDHVGEEFDGVVSGVTEWGLYVEIIENKCEGMIPIKDLGDDFYSFDEENYCLVGRNFNRKYQLGQPLRIVIAKANLERKQLDFSLALDDNDNSTK